ncbi:MAG TPA: sugar ABC transporter substrate-binding protein [Chloroflexota bacterium]
MADPIHTPSRRRFLAASVAAVLVGPILQACGQAAAPTAAPAAKPTEAPKPAAAAPTAAPAAAKPAEPTQPPAAATKPAEPTAAPAAAKPATTGATKSMRFSSYTWSGYEDAMKVVLDMWRQENAGVDIKGEYVGEDYWTKLQTQIGAGTPPDVGIGEFVRVVSFGKGNVLMELDDLIARDKVPLDQHFSASVAQYRWQSGEFDSGGKGGKMYGLPSDGQGHIFVYNKKMFDEAGVKYPTDDWNWNDVVEAAKKMTKPDQNKWGAYVPGLGVLGRGNFLYAAGGELISPDFKKSGLDMPESIDAYKWAWDLIYTHKVAPKPLPKEPANPFASGRVGMYFDGVWWIGDFVEIKDFEWDVAQFPKHPKTGKRTTSLEADGWWAFKATKDRDLAWSLTKFLGSDKAQRKFGELEFVVPSSIPEVAKDWYAKKPPASRAKALENVEKDSRKVARTFFDVAKVEGAFTPLLQKAFFDGQDITATMKEAAKAMNEELAKAWQRFGQQ